MSATSPGRVGHRPAACRPAGRHGPSRCHSSSARCGVIGPSSRTIVSSASRSSARSPVARRRERLDRVRELADQRHGLVEVQPLELGRSPAAMVRWTRRLSAVPRRRPARPARRPRGRPRRALVDQPPEPVQVAPGAVDAGVGPFQVAVGRAVGEHEQARGVGAVALDDRASGRSVLRLDLLIFSTRPARHRPAVRRR